MPGNQVAVRVFPYRPRSPNMVYMNYRVLSGVLYSARNSSAALGVRQCVC